MDRQHDEGSDEELMAAFSRGSDAAFDRLAERWWRPLLTFYRNKGFSNEDSEDLSQETLVRLYSTRRKGIWRPGHPLRPYLFQIAARLAIEKWRASNRQRALCDALIHFVSRLGLAPGLGERLFLAIWDLPEPQQTCILLCGRHGVGELEHNDIARILDRSAPRIAELCQRAREMLRAALGTPDSSSSVASGPGSCQGAKGN